MENARVCLAPLRFGAGIKGKLAEAMMCGTPSVTTSIGAEAMNASLDWSGIIADNTADFASAAIKFYTDKSIWEKAQQNGVNIINKRFSKVLPGEQLLQRILSLQKNIKQHRLNNFTGAMLMHHNMAGTKYMSRWIEEKNRGKE